MYAMVCTRPDIAHAVGVVSTYMNNPGKEHWMAVKWILRYLKGTTNQALCFGSSNISPQGYVYADMEDDRDNRRSTTGYVFTIGGTTVSQVFKIQSVVALSTTEAEYVATTKAKSKKCTFIGYDVNDFCYFLYDYKNHKIIRSRDVIFNEKVLYKNQLQEINRKKKARNMQFLMKSLKK